MDIDWPIALAVLLLFISWALVIFGGMYKIQKVPLTEVADGVNKKILDFLKVSVFEVPVNFTSAVVDGSKVLYLDFVWPESTKNSTKLFNSGSSQSCSISGSRVFWQTSVTNSSNQFRMRITTQPQPQNCSGTFDTANSSQTIPNAMEKLTMITNQKISEVTAKSYSAFKSNISVNSDFSSMSPAPSAPSVPPCRRLQTFPQRKQLPGSRTRIRTR